MGGFFLVVFFLVDERTRGMEEWLTPSGHTLGWTREKPEVVAVKEENPRNGEKNGPAAGDCESGTVGA